jgi:prepilin-type N-terminal cleavage/methylation domain-containing protein
MAQILARSRNEEGMSLLEVTLAMAIVAVALGISAQSLLSIYVLLDMQHQRVVAVNHCRSILSGMRNVRDANQNLPDSETRCQAAILAAYPDDSTFPGPQQLPNSTVSVTYENSSPSANPLLPTVVMNWTDMRGRPMRLQLSTAISDR